MAHAFAWFAEGVDPWGMKVAEEGSDTTTSFSLRVAAWHVTRSATYMGNIDFPNRKFAYLFIFVFE